MKLKKFIAPTTREALQKLRAELGEDAIILSTKQTAAGTEVLAAASNDLDDMTQAANVQAQAPAQPASWTRSDRMAYQQNQQLERAPVQQAHPQVPAFQNAPKAPVTHPGLMQAWGEPIHSPSNAPEQQVSAAQDNMLNNVARQRAQAANDAMAQEQARVLEEIKQMRQLMQDQMAMLTWRDAVERNPQRAEVWNQLNNAGFSPLFARTVADKLPEGLTASQMQDWLMNVLVRNVSAVNAQDDIVERGGAWALVGPTGVGKTTTTAKLAARCVVKYGADSLGLITTDSYRIGAQDQLRIYGKILGVQVYTAQNDADLAQLRSSLQRKRLLLIDTVGMGQRDARVGEQTQMLEDSQVKRLLLLNSTAHPETLEDVVRHYKHSGLEGAILTKLDESIKLGGVLDIAIRHKLKLHYMATGQRVPEDLYMADPRVLVHRALKVKSSNAFVASDDELKLKMAQVPATGF